MRRLARCSRRLVPALALVGLLTAAPRAQQTPAERTLRTTANPTAGLRGNSERGLAQRGATARGVGQRTTSRVVPAPVDTQPKDPRDTSAQPARPAPAVPAPALAPLAAPRPAAAGLARRPGRPRASDEALLLRAARQLHAARLAEAGETLDWLLERPGSQDEVQDLLSRSDLGSDAPWVTAAPRSESWLSAVLAAGARSSPAGRELLLLDLADYGARERNTLEAALRAEAREVDPGRRSFARLALTRWFGEGAGRR